MPVSPDEFRSALSRFASGVTVVTARDAAGRFFGITVSAFCSVSLEPPLVLICLENATASRQAVETAGTFVVNVLDSSAADISERFASQLDDKFDDADFTLNIDGVPILTSSIAVLECRVRNTCDGGDHSIFIGEVEQLSFADGDPLIYFRSDYRTIAAT